jgi:hypothetical protein
MSVDLAQRNRIWDLQTEIDQARFELRAISKAIAELPEAVALREAEQALDEATRNLKTAMRSNREYARLAVARGDLKWRLDDLKDQQSRTIEVYRQDSGLEVVRDKDNVPHPIVAIYRVDAKHTAADQPKLPLSQHFGVRQVIGEVPAAKQLELMQENK